MFFNHIPFSTMFGAELFRDGWRSDSSRQGPKSCEIMAWTDCVWWIQHASNRGPDDFTAAAATTFTATNDDSGLFRWIYKHGCSILSSRYSIFCSAQMPLPMLQHGGGAPIYPHPSQTHQHAAYYPPPMMGAPMRMGPPQHYMGQPQAMYDGPRLGGPSLGPGQCRDFDDRGTRDSRSRSRSRSPRRRDTRCASRVVLWDC